MKALQNQGQDRADLPINGADKPPLKIEAGELHNLSDQELRSAEALAEARPELFRSLVFLELDGHGRPIEAEEGGPQ